MVLASLILAASVPAPVNPWTTPGIFTPADHRLLSKRAKQDCGYASPEEIEPLAIAERQKILTCFVAAAVKDGAALVPRVIEPGAIITSVGQIEDLLTMEVRIAPDHPRALAKKGASIPFDETLANLTCRDQWLGGMLDAGMDGDKQAGTIILYTLKDTNGVTIHASGISQCHGGKRGD